MRLRPSAIATLLVHLSVAAGAWAQEAKPPAEEEVPVEDVPTEEVAPVEAAGDEATEDPGRPPPKGKGVVWGVVTDATTNEPLIDAQISVVGTKQKTIADIDGRFRLELPPGTYELRVWYELYEARRLANVRIVAGQVQKVDVALEADDTAEDVVEVETTPERASAAAQLVMRKNAPAVGDAIGAQEIAKTPDKNAAEAAKRIVGATVVDNKYVYVRGLGERYTNAQLDGAPLPSVEPDRQAVPLDLFPALVIADITVAKTFTPDMPGDFAGGSVIINTRELPDRFYVQGSVSAGINTASTFRQRLTYKGSSTDWLGFDNGTRSLPEGIPDYKLVRQGEKPDGTLIKRDELQKWGRELNAYMSTRRTTNAPNLSGSVVVGDTLKPGGEQQIGYLVALTYGRRFSIRQGIERGPSLDNDYTFESGLDEVGWGGLAQLTYKPSKDHAFTILGFHSRSSEKMARIIQGFNEERATEIHDTKLRFLSRSLTMGRLFGEHTFKPLQRAVFDWNVSLSKGTADEPDTRATVYTRDAQSGLYGWDEGGDSGTHFFAEQVEDAYGGGLDWTQPIVSGDRPVKLKAGAALSVKSREFDSRRFRYTQRAGADPAIFRNDQDRLFVDENIGPVLELTEDTRDSDAYTAEQDVYAGYLMADAWTTRWLRAIVGGRIEVTDQRIDSFDPFKAGTPTVSGDASSTDLLPAAGLVFRTNESSNLRFSLARTLARPQLAELNPAPYTDYYGARTIQGNPKLELTSVVNADMRFEVFPAAGEVAAVSVFFKHFEDPVERTIIPTSKGSYTFQNTPSARLAGAELEIKKGLSALTPALKPFSVQANLTIVRSQVDVSGVEFAEVLTSKSRPLVGASPWVVNAAIDYANESGTRVTLLYNVFGRRLHAVNANGVPDTYEQPRHVFDATAGQRLGKHVDLKLSIENVFNAPYVLTAGESWEDEDANVVSKHTRGTTFSLGLTVKD